MSHGQERLVPDTITTLQTSKNSRVLIGGNTKGNSSGWEQRDYFRAETWNCSFTRNMRIVRKRDTRKHPFQTGRDWPNSQGQSGSFRIYSPEPALVQIRVALNYWLFTVSGRYSITQVLPIQAWLLECLAEQSQYWSILAKRGQYWSILAKKVNIASSGQNTRLFRPREWN